MPEQPDYKELYNLLYRSTNAAMQTLQEGLPGSLRAARHRPVTGRTRKTAAPFYPIDETDMQRV